MKIKELNVGNMERTTPNRVAANRYQNAAQTGTQIPREDDVSFSSTARTINQAEEVVRNTPAVRAEKIGPIKAAVQAGRYDVSPSKVTDKILSQVLSYRKNAL